MQFMLDRSIKKPMYRQLAEQIENGILSGDLSQDQPLPSERELAKKLGINRSTVVTAYDELEASGLIDRKKGSGTYINTDIWGLTHKRVPNWGRYVEDGSFLPNLPLVQKLRNETEQEGMINLSSGELAADLQPNAQFARILKDYAFDANLGYDHPLGDVELRETICQHVKTYKNMVVEPNSILITSGAQQAIHLIVQCLLKPGDTVAIEDPSYAFSLPIFQSFGIKTLLLPVDQYGLNPDDIVALQRKHRIRMLFLNPDYQNPTGTKMSLERRKRILELSSTYGIPIIEDDPYNLTSFDGDIGPTLKSMDDNENVLYISSLSKVVASGLRIGWIIGPEKVITRLSDGKQQIDFGHSVFPQWIANQFLDSPQFDKHVSNLRIQLKERRDALILALDSLTKNEITYVVPQGGIHLWCKIHHEMDEYKLLEESMKNGVSFVPGRLMGSKNGYVRFTYGKGNGASIQEGISRFASALRSYRG
ncbi:GntR family transcriptional regulator [Sporosarcina sp. P18a]|uniref:MocR-like pyridoxine biosynthesis transcription factor PdxR n=1 Tax=Sporosarcina sp. P18a TaxID=2048259 RepID=UPI000C172216|nr:PLP-dependent aminotransferase family protein [Sporosarcina sp. P18a]PIC79421.1 GntR family transcriptional regulator [Sporosarcina sp. P18a]